MAGVKSVKAPAPAKERVQAAAAVQPSEPAGLLPSVPTSHWLPVSLFFPFVREACCQLHAGWGLIPAPHAALAQGLLITLIQELWKALRGPSAELFSL